MCYVFIEWESFEQREDGVHLGGYFPCYEGNMVKHP